MSVHFRIHFYKNLDRLQSIAPNPSIASPNGYSAGYHDCPLHLETCRCNPQASTIALQPSSSEQQSSSSEQQSFSSELDRFTSEPQPSSQTLQPSTSAVNRSASPPEPFFSEPQSPSKEGINSGLSQHDVA